MNNVQQSRVPKVLRKVRKFNLMLDAIQAKKSKGKFQSEITERKVDHNRRGREREEAEHGS